MIVNLSGEGAKWVCQEVCKIVYKGDAEKAEKKGNQWSRANAFKWALRNVDEGDFDNAVEKLVAETAWHFEGIERKDLAAALKKVVKKMPKTLPFPTTEPVTDDSPVANDDGSEDEDGSEEDDQD